MRHWLREITYFDDMEPHSAAMNMAIDEVLLGAATGAIFRVYRWEAPAVSFGYFERWGPIRESHPDRDAVRRWTGGGVVLHGSDLTYSLLVPRAVGADLGPLDSYSLIHGALVRALCESGISAEASAGAGATVSRACFENPVQHDVLVNGRKVAGGAQRRTRAGLMHQGSIQGVDLPVAFAAGFAAQLAGRLKTEAFDLMPEAAALAQEKYGSQDWLEKVL